MSENTTRLQATGGNVNYWSHQLFGHVPGRNVNYWSHQLFGHVWKYNKIPGKPPIIVQCVKVQRDCRQRGKIEVTEATTCENTTRFQATTRLQAMRGTFKLLTPPDILHCLRLQQDCRQRRQISIIEATNELAMSENTTRLQATGGNVNYWSHQLFGHVRKYNKIPGKPPIIVQCVKIQQNCRQRGEIEAIEATMCENTTRFQASDQLVCIVWDYKKIAGNGGKLK